ncbi:hypothetical protein JOB18_048610 [Solea senegalensis]|uniref:Uncharacterized protein n=1 Tax=Solea senegalensis TaxID=28829 RepID=A0AAV6Q5A6_SOLSE|nr:hypothetical protein JOB18_048610 [Solea senegalensis]
MKVFHWCVSTFSKLTRHRQKCLKIDVGERTCLSDGCPAQHWVLYRASRRRANIPSVIHHHDVAHIFPLRQQTVTERHVSTEANCLHTHSQWTVKLTVIICTELRHGCERSSGVYVHLLS